MGTTLDKVEESPGYKKYKNSFEARVFENSLNHMGSVSERLIQFPRFAPVLRGMTLTNPPNGGYSGGPPRVIVGADASLTSAPPTYFEQPGEPSKWIEVDNGIPHTGAKPGAELVYKTADLKLRSEHGAMSTKRAEQEAAKGRRRRDRHYAAIMNDVELPAQQATNTTLSALSPAPALTPIPMITQERALQMPFSNTSPNRIAEISATSPVPAPSPSPAQFIKNIKQLLTSNPTQNDVNTFFINNWPYLIICLLLIVTIVLLIVSLVQSVNYSKRNKSSKNTLGPF